MLNNYVLGFALSQNRSVVLLINKLKPTWQANRLNGVGGLIKPGESDVDAMVREFREEVGITTQWAEWSKFATRTDNQEYVVHCFRTFLPTKVLCSYEQKTAEKPQLHYIRKLPTTRMVRDVPTLIHLATIRDIREPVRIVTMT